MSTKEGLELMREAAGKQAEIYERRGEVRHMIVMKMSVREKIKNLAKAYRVQQGDVIDVVIENMDLTKVGPALEARREVKAKPKKTEIAKKIRGLSPEKLAQIEAIIES